jgi:hypothetical protein
MKLGAALVALAVALLGALMPAESLARGESTTLAEQCGHERVYCLIVAKGDDGRVRFALVGVTNPGTSKSIPYDLCVRRISRPNRVCRSFRTKRLKATAFGGVVDFRRAFPFQGPGEFRATWLVGPQKKVLGHPLNFDLPVRRGSSPNRNLTRIAEGQSSGALKLLRLAPRS